MIETRHRTKIIERPRALIATPYADSSVGFSIWPVVMVGFLLFLFLLRAQRSRNRDRSGYGQYQHSRDNCCSLGFHVGSFQNSLHKAKARPANYRLERNPRRQH
jgi:hypothetical protein